MNTIAQTMMNTDTDADGRTGKRKPDIVVLGAGTWGTALARLFANTGKKVTVWSIDPREVEEYSLTRRHPKLPGMIIPKNIEFTADISCVNAGSADDADCAGSAACADEAGSVDGPQFIVFAVPSVYIRSTAEKAARYLNGAKLPIIINVAKGIEKGTLFTMSDILHDVFPEHRVVTLSGPTHAEEVALDMPTTIVSACADTETAETVRRLFDGTCIRAYINTDVTGVELSGALKNIIALAAGISVGAGYGDNSKAAIITRGLAEIKRLGVAMGCSENTFSGLAGIGDLVVTATSMHSRNNKCGMLIGQGVPAEEAVKQVGMVVEGLNALGPAMDLAEKYHVEMPVVIAVSKVVSGMSAKEAAAGLLTKPSSTGDYVDR